jgi:hypothetical protein
MKCFLSLVLAMYYMWSSYQSHKAFLEEYLYIFWYRWVAVFQDFYYIVQDYWAWSTLNNIPWERGEIVLMQKAE